MKRPRRKLNGRITQSGTMTANVSVKRWEDEERSEYQEPSQQGSLHAALLDEVVFECIARRGMA